MKVWTLVPKSTKAILAAFYTIVLCMFIVAVFSRVEQPTALRIAGAIAATSNASALLLGLLALPLNWKAFFSLALFHSIGVLFMTYISLFFYANGIPNSNPILAGVKVAMIDYLRIMLSSSGIFLSCKFAILYSKASNSNEE